MGALSLASGAPVGQQCDALGDVNTLTLSGTTLYAGGSFTQIGRSPNAYFAGMSTTVTSVTEGHKFIPRESVLEQNYPNPFNPTTNIEFRISNTGLVNLKMFDVLGKEVAILVNEYLPPGSYTKTWNAADLPSGVYFYRLQCGASSETRKLLLVR